MTNVLFIFFTFLHAQLKWSQNYDLKFTIIKAQILLRMLCCVNPVRCCPLVVVLLFSYTKQFVASSMNVGPRCNSTTRFCLCFTSHHVSLIVLWYTLRFIAALQILCCVYWWRTKTDWKLQVALTHDVLPSLCGEYLSRSVVNQVCSFWTAEDLKGLNSEHLRSYQFIS